MEDSLNNMLYNIKEYWIMTPCRLVDSYKHFKDLLPSICALNTGAPHSSKISVTITWTAQCHSPDDCNLNLPLVKTSYLTYNLELSGEICLFASRVKDSEQINNKVRTTCTPCPCLSQGAWNN
jgi:hypothetical protein